MPLPRNTNFLSIDTADDNNYYNYMRKLHTTDTSLQNIMFDLPIQL